MTMKYIIEMKKVNKNRIFKKYVAVLAFIVIMLQLTFVSCGKCDCHKLTAEMSADCASVSFIEQIIARPGYDNFRYLIKGEVIGKNRHGLKIELIEDIKGNFPKKNTEVFTAWGRGPYYPVSDYRDDLSKWKIGDTLVMLLDPYSESETRFIKDFLYETGRSECFKKLWFEKPGDFRTLTCSNSTLKISGSSIIGQFVYPFWVCNHSFDRTVPLDEFNEVVYEILLSGYSEKTAEDYLEDCRLVIQP
jgi:hypothetical protein